MLRVPADSLQAERRPPRNHMFICMQRKKQRAKDREDKKPRKHKTKRRTQRATTDRRGRKQEARGRERH